MKRLASRLTWWPTRRHKSTPAVNAADRRGQSLHSIYAPMLWRTNMSPEIVSSSEAGSRRVRSVSTGWLVVIDRPRSPRTRSPLLANELLRPASVDTELDSDLFNRLLRGGR